MIVKRVILGLAAAWGVFWLSALGPRMTSLVGALGRIGLPPEARAEFSSGDPPYHRFLRRLAAHDPGGGGVLVLGHDPAGQHGFRFYRAAHELYPVKVRYIPVNGVPDEAVFTFRVGAELRRAVARDGARLAGAYRQADPGRSAMYAVAPEGADGLKFTRLPEPGTPPRPPRRGSPALWIAGLASLAGLGWAFNALTGLDRPVRRDPAARLALAWFAGTGLTVWFQLVLSLAGVRWSLPALLAPWAAVLGASAAWRRRGGFASPGGGEDGTPETGAWNRAGMALAGAAVLCAVLRAAAPMSAWSHWDAWAIWTFKARACWDAMGIPYPLLTEPLYAYSHHDYPLGLPALNTYLGMWAGALDERMLRGLSPVYHVVLIALSARLLLEFGVARHRWLLAGALAWLPNVLDQAGNGYADLPVAAGMTACLVALSAWRAGRWPAWGVALIAGAAAQLKDEGFVWGGACLLIVAAGEALRGPGAGRRAALVALALFAALVAPWKGVTRSLGLKPNDYVISPSRMLVNLPSRAPVVVKGVLLESVGPGATMQALAGEGSFGARGWFLHLRGRWMALWITVAAALVLGWRGLAVSPRREAALVVAVQAAAYAAVYLASVKDLSWHVVTSLDRLLLQLAPACWALACAALAHAAGLPAPAGPRAEPRGD